MKRIKTISDVFHRFAQQYGGNYQSSNVFCEGNKIYSFGYHYLLGEFIDNKTILINDTYYSNTTSRHTRILRQATRQYKQYCTSQIHACVLDRKYIELSEKLAKAKKPELYYSYLITLLDSFDEFNKSYPKHTSKNDKNKIEKIRHGIKKIQNGSGIEEIKKRIEKRNKARKKAIRLKEENDKKELLKRIAKFYKYEIDSIRIDFDLLRLSEDREYIETTQRVKIPINSAFMLYNAIIQRVDVTGYNIENFKIQRIDSDIFYIGCHKFKKDELLKAGQAIEFYKNQKMAI